MATMTIEQRINRARVRLLMTNPFFGTLLFRLPIVEDTKSPCKTAYTDGRKIGYYPPYIEPLSEAELEGLLIHEVLHVALMHHIRIGHRQHERWNIAVDFVVDGYIEAAGLKVPDSMYQQMPGHDHFREMSGEAIYNLLPEMPSGGGGRAGQVVAMPGGDNPAIVQAEENDIKIAINQALMAARNKQRGDMPAWMQQLIDQVCIPKVSWKDHLRQFISSKTRCGQTWNRVNRRYASQGLYLPGIRRSGTGTGVIYFDTSGSTSNDWAQFLSECKSIIEDTNPDAIHVVQCDAGVGDIQSYEAGESISPTIVGGGGSDFRPAFQAVEDRDIRPDWAVVLSDMDIAFPDEAPNYPVMFFSTNSEGPSWAPKTIKID